MAFNPADFGATPVRSGVFDPSQFGATPVSPSADSFHAAAMQSPMQKFSSGQAQSNPFDDIANQWKSGQQMIDQPFINKGANGSPGIIGAAEGALQIGAGLITKLSAPLAPLLNPTLGAGVNALGNSLSNFRGVNTPFGNFGDIQGFGRDTASLPADTQTQPERILSNLSNAGTVAQGLAGGLEAPKAVAPVADSFHSLAAKTADTASSVASSISDTAHAAKNIVSPDADAIVANRVSELQKLENNNAQVRKVITQAAAKGTDLKSILAQTDLLHGAVDDTGTLRTQNAMSEMNDFIKPQEDVISQNLKQEGATIPLDTLKTNMTQAVMDSGIKGGALLRGLKNVQDDIAGYQLEADKKGNIPISVVHDAKVDKYANIDYSNPETKRVDKVIAKTLKQTVEDNTKSVNVKALNAELAQHYSILNLLEKMDGKKVDGGKLGKYFAQTVGGIAGSHFGPLGTIVGAEVAGRIKGATLASTMNGKTGNVLTQSDAMKSAVAQGQGYENSLGSRNTTQANTIAPTTNDISPTLPQAGKEATPLSTPKSSSSSKSITQKIQDIFKTNPRGMMKLPNLGGQAPKMPVAKISEATNALKANDATIKPGAVARAIQEITSGKMVPIRIRTLPDGKLFIEDGRHRLEAAKQLGLDNFPVENVTKQYAQSRDANGRFK